jgi:hypothetical protein
MINEAALHSEFWTSASDAEPSLATSSSIARSKMLWRSLSSCQDLIYTFLSHRSEDLFYHTAFVCPRLVYAFIALAKLVALFSETKRVSESQSVTSDFPNLPGSMADLINEVNYQELAKQVLDKFTAISTDFVGADGRRDSMANAASGMRLMIAGYERQIKELQTPLQGAEMSAPVDEIFKEDVDTVGSTAYAYDQEIHDGDGSFDMDFAGELPGNTFWDDVLDSFTIVPYL